MSAREVLALLVVMAAPATADPLRLRADALASTQSPVGLLTLEGEGDAAGWLTAEALVWLGAGVGVGDDVSGASDGDALVIALRARRPGGAAEARLGRMVIVSGALRPLHLDGVAGRVRLPRRMDAEAFVGVPVVAGVGAQAWDWAVGGRVSRRIGDWGSGGVAMLERREVGRLAARELGLDGGAAVGRGDIAGKVALDLLDGGAPAVALAEASAGTRRSAWRGELYGGFRSPSHLVPATSLFSVLGDVTSQQGGARITWRAAPRLDLWADAGVRRIDDDLAEELAARATLRLDDRGRGALIAELRRNGDWTGGRAAARVPVATAWTVSSEVELVIPDQPGARAAIWPWALAALGWTGGPWDVALALEASVAPDQRGRLDALCRVGRRWGLP